MAIPHVPILVEVPGTGAELHTWCMRLTEPLHVSFELSGQDVAVQGLCIEIIEVEMHGEQWLVCHHYAPIKSCNLHIKLVKLFQKGIRGPGDQES